MTVESVIARLEGVRRVGNGRWRAKCPAHGGKNPYALAIREAEDGAVLLHCFACEGGAGAIAQALGIDLADLFPPKRDPLVPGKRMHKPYRASDTLMALTNDLRAAYILCGRVSRGQVAGEKDKEWARQAQKRIGRLLGELDMAG